MAVTGLGLWGHCGRRQWHGSHQAQDAVIQTLYALCLHGAVMSEYHSQGVGRRNGTGRQGSSHDELEEGVN